MNVIACVDRDGIQVVCDDGTWYNHIIAEHPEMEGWEAYVKATVENPYQIYQDHTQVNKKAFYKPFILPKPWHTQYLRVVIEYRKSRKLGYICTAFPCSNIRKGDILIWQGTL